MKCQVTFCDSDTMQDYNDYCWGCYDRILENEEVSNTNPQDFVIVDQVIVCCIDCVEKL